MGQTHIHHFIDLDMTQEEKAKAYDEALERAKRYNVDDAFASQGTIVKRIFPVLAESEDERIRKEIVSALKFANDGGVYDKHIAYLEKQKVEVDPTDASWDAYYRRGWDKGYRVGLEAGRQEQKPAEWDELQAEFRNINEAFENGKKEVVAHPKKYGLCKPAEWSEEEMKLLDSIIDDYEKAAKSFCGYDGKIGLLKAIRDGEYDLPKPEWSKEDERNIRNLESILYYDKKLPEETRVELGNFLKSLPERFSLRPKQECGKAMINGEPISTETQSVDIPLTKWSEEDEKVIEDLIIFVSGYADKRVVKDWVQFLKSLRPQPHTISIKDATKFGNLEYERGVKDGIQSEKSHRWKPSEEQMKALEECGECKRCIKELCEQLKKRM